MTKAKKIFLIFALSILAVAGVAAAGIFAYFSSSASSSKGVKTEIVDGAFIAQVSSFDELYEVSKSEYYNDKNIVSETRKVIRLTGDISLPVDLVVTADVHIDLNGHTLDLNERVLTIQHAYAGSFVIYNGTMSANNGKLVIDTPNAAVEYDDAFSDFTSVISQEFDYTAYAALYAATDGLGSALEKRPARLNYTAFTAGKPADGVYDPSVFLAQKTHESNTEACVYVAVGRDLILPARYLATGYTITYASAAPAILSDAGNALSAGDTTLTVTVTDDTGANSASVTLPVHVVASGTAAVAEVLLKSYFAGYYRTGSVVSDGITHSAEYYLFSNGMELPLKDEDLGITLTYTPLRGDKSNAATTSATENGVYVFEPNDQCAYLRVTLNGSASVYFDLPVYSNYVANGETAARSILNRLYGGAIVYDSTQSYTVLYDLAYVAADSALGRYVTDYDITGISYAIKAGSAAADSYEIVEGKLMRKAGSVIPAEKLEFITCTFTFGSGAEQTSLAVDLYVLYVTGNEGTANNFLIYYNNYDGKVPSETSVTFEMPFSYNGGAPYSAYEFALNYTFDEETGVYTLTDSAYSSPAAISLVLKYGTNSSDEFSYAGGTSLSAQFNTWLTTNGLTLAGLASQGAVWEITVTANQSVFEDSEVLLLYKYTFESNAAGSAPSWTVYRAAIEGADGAATYEFTQSTVSPFTLKGGVFYDASSAATNAVNDSVLFSWMKSSFGIAGNVELIENDALTLPVTVDVTVSATLASVKNWNGIQYLTGATAVNLTGVTVDDALIQILNQMTFLQSLIMQNCSLTDTEISGLALPKLRTLNVADNGVNDFSWLTVDNFPALQRVYVYGNENADGYRGSTGMSNYQTFEDLVRAGVNVYNTLNSNSVPMLFESSTDLNDYRRLKSIVYQSVLKTGVSITTVYSRFMGLTTSDFSLEGSYTGTVVWDYGGGTNDEDATWFSATVTTTTGVELTVKFYVDRYEEEVKA